jgi:hypothetical protein
MRTIGLALVAGMLAACATLSGEIDDKGRAYRETIDAPVGANLEPSAAEPSIQLFSGRIPARGSAGEEARERPEPQSACQAERWQSLISMTEAEARGEPLPEVVRVVPYQGIVTQDYREDRLNIYLDSMGRVFRVTCG